MSLIIQGVQGIYRGSMGAAESGSNILEGVSDVTAFGTKVTGKLFGTLKKLLGGKEPDVKPRRSARLATKRLPRKALERGPASPTRLRQHKTPQPARRRSASPKRQPAKR